ncbi:sugar ABC transporter substrate-binding protein [Qaidamihabitans albus]|uniref:sugar ABC transporter substrate-binding protein n=1 Tax=Qaidamihabitans albus TaxID=2795733 RepID=UPI0018F17471|nr:sugar ABC transporter substrate-binding protein [Qaidamihabitans albus]
MACAATAGLLLTSCSTVEQSDSGASAESDYANEAAQKVVDRALAEFEPTDFPTSSPAAAEDKTLVIVSCYQAAAGCARISAGALEAAEAIGWKAKVVDGQGDPNLQNSALEQAITEKADAVLLAAVEYPVVASTVERVRKAGIHVVSVGTTGEASEDGVEYFSTAPGEKIGEVMAAWVTLATAGNGNIGYFSDRSFAASDAYETGFRDGIKQYCENCSEAFTTSFSATEIGTTLPARVKGSLQSHPDVNMVYAAYDGAVGAMVPAMHEISSTAPLVGFDGNLQSLDFIREGNTQVATMATALEWAAWGGVDALNRLLNGEEPVPSTPAYRLLTKDNLPPDGQSYTGDTDYRAAYRELWQAG